MENSFYGIKVIIFDKVHYSNALKFEMFDEIRSRLSKDRNWKPIVEKERFCIFEYTENPQSGHFTMAIYNRDNSFSYMLHNNQENDSELIDDIYDYLSMFKK